MVRFSPLRRLLTLVERFVGVSPLFSRHPRNQSDVGAKHFVQIACAIGLHLF